MIKSWLWCCVSIRENKKKLCSNWIQLMKQHEMGKLENINNHQVFMSWATYVGELIYEECVKCISGNGNFHNVLCFQDFRKSIFGKLKFKLKIWRFDNWMFNSNFLPSSTKLPCYIHRHSQPKKHLKFNRKTFALRLAQNYFAEKHFQWKLKQLAWVHI